MRGPDGQVSLSTKLYYGIGSIAYGVKDNGFSYFLLFFYNQVMGLPSTWVAGAIFIALCFDALSDPIVGYTSDNWRSKWGRRHPFMYAAAVPVAVSYYFLWNPPAGLTDVELFTYLVFLAVLVRTFITFYEIPSTSLVAEFTQNYEERTSMLAFRYFFGWSGGITIAVLAYRFMFVSTDTIENGMFNKAGYSTYGLIGASIIFVAIIVSAVGTHRHIPSLRKPPPKQPFVFAHKKQELTEILSNRSFLVLFGSAIFAAAAAGISSGMNVYFNTLFWGLSPPQIAFVALSLYLSALMALMFSPFFGRLMGKRNAAITTFSTAIIMAPVPLFLRLAGYMPPDGSDALVAWLFVFNGIEISFVITASILISSMVADIVEESELKTGLRSEGLFFAARGFAAKIVSGGGILMAGIILAAANISGKSKPGEVPSEDLETLVFIYAPTFMILYGIAIAFIFAYRISRESHEENVARLSEKLVE